MCESHAFLVQIYIEFRSLNLCGMCVFFKQKTAYEMRISDWSSDVCSSDLVSATGPFLHVLPLQFGDETVQRPQRRAGGGGVDAGQGAGWEVGRGDRRGRKAFHILVLPVERQIQRADGLHY